MNKCIIFFFSLIATFTEVKAQDQEAPSCGTPDEMIFNKYSTEDPSVSRILDAGIDWMPIQVYRVTNDDGTASRHSSTTELERNLIKTNEYFINSNIQVYSVGSEITINRNSALEVDNNTEAFDLHTEYDDPEVFEIFINDGFTDNGTPEPYTGRSYGDFIIMNVQAFSTLIHEIGHSLGLPHTFATNNGVELVTRDPETGNCDTAGDGICDTHADPYDLTTDQYTGEEYDYSLCTMASDTRDMNGDLYTPPYPNLMSYYSDDCGLEFTPGQYEKMKNTWLTYYEGRFNEDLTRPEIVAVPSSLSSQYDDGHITLTWANATGGMEIQIEYSYDGENFTLLDVLPESTTEYKIPNYQNDQSYFVRIRYLNSRAGTYSTTHEVVTDKQVYCLMRNLNSTQLNTNNTCGEVIIEKAGLANSNNISEYYNYYNSDTAWMMPGGNYKINLRGVRSEENNITYSTSFVVFLDSDQSGTFEKDEIIFRSEPEYLVTSRVESTITIPENAVQGTTRMRVFSSYTYDYNNIDGCGIYNEPFEVEDYPVRIPDPEKTPGSLIATHNPAEETIELNWDFNKEDSWFVVYKSEDLETFTAADTVQGTRFYDIEFFGGKTYAYKVSRLFGQKSEMTSITIPEHNYSYCQPTFSYPCSLDGLGVNSIKEAVTGFSLETTECSAYENSRDDTLRVYAGETYSLTIGAGGWTNTFYAVWADYNRNGEFNDDEKLAEGPTNQRPVSGISFTVPESLESGVTFLRFMAWNSSGTEPMTACGSANDGQAEDITMQVIVVDPENTPQNLTASFSDEEEAVQLSWEFDQPDADFVVYKSDDLNNFYVLDTIRGTGLTGNYKDTHFFGGNNYAYRVSQLYGNPGETETITIPEGYYSYCSPDFRSLCSFSGLGINSIREAITGFSVSTPECVAYEDSRNDTLTVYTGQSYSFDLNLGYEDMSYAIWADFNRNSTFDPEEKTVEGTSSSSTASGINFNIPEETGTGITFLRFATWVMPDTDPMTACGSAYDGQAEDITLNIKTINPDNIPENLTAAFSEADEAVRLTWDFNLPDGDFVIYRSSDLYSYQAIDTVHRYSSDYSYIDHNIGQAINYGYRVSQIHNNPGEEIFVYVPGRDVTECLPTFSDPCGLEDYGVNRIEETTTGFVVETSSCEAFDDSKDHVLQVNAGDTYQLNLNFGMYVGTKYAVWADYDQNGNFESGEKITTGEANSAVADITIPTTAMTGETVMRVMTWFNEDVSPMTACGSAYLGQAEDITLNITGGRNPAPENFNSNLTNGELTLSWVFSEIATAADEVIIESSTDGAEFTEFGRLTGTEVSYSLSPFKPSSATIFRIYTITGDNTSPYSNLSKVTPAPVLGITGGQAEHVKVFPNPSSSGVISIESDAPLEVLTVSSPSGSVITDWKKRNGEVDLSRLPKGVYFLHLKINNEMVIKRVTIL